MTNFYHVINPIIYLVNVFVLPSPLISQNICGAKDHQTNESKRWVSIGPTYIYTCTHNNSIPIRIRRVLRGNGSITKILSSF